MHGNKRERAAVNTAFNKLERAPTGTRHDTMLRAAVTIYNNGDREDDWHRLYAYARGVRGEHEARKMRAYVARTAGATSSPIPTSPASPEPVGNKMPRVYNEPPDWLRLGDGHWLAHGNPGSLHDLVFAPTDSPAYDRAKVMSARRWKVDPLSHDEARAAWYEARAIALIPASVRILVLDVDNADRDVTVGIMDRLADMLGSPVYSAPTRKGWHILVPTELMLGNGNFTIGEAIGQVRSVDGYVVVHGMPYMAALEACREAPPLAAWRGARRLAGGE